LALVVAIIAIVLWVSHNKTSTSSIIPSWLFKGIGIFLLIMFLYNLTDAINFLKTESVSWWPIIRQGGTNFSEYLRDVIKTATGGK